MFVVFIHKTFDGDMPAYSFKDDEEEKAGAYLHWMWERDLNEARSGDAILDEEGCFCNEENDYAQIEWFDGDKVEYVLTYMSDPEPEFEKVDWKKYLPKEDV